MKVTKKIEVLYAQGPVDILTMEYQYGRATTDLEVSSTDWDAKKQAWSLDVLVFFEGNWVAATTDTWLSVDAYAPDRFSIITTTNTTGAERTGTVTVTPVGGSATTITVTQSATGVTLFGATPATLPAIAQEGGRSTFALTCPGHWTCDCLSDWAHVQKVITGDQTTYAYTGSGLKNANLCIVADANTTGKARSGFATFYYNKKRVRVNFSQQGVGLTVNPTSVSVTSAAGTKDVVVTTTANWTAAVTTEGATWLTVAKDQVDATKLVLTLEANTATGAVERTATVRVTAGDTYEDIPVTQAATPAP